MCVRLPGQVLPLSADCHRFEFVMYAGPLGWLPFSLYVN